MCAVDLSHMYHDARFRESKGVFNYAVCLMAVCVVKQVAYSTELQNLYCSYVPGMVMDTGF